MHNDSERESCQDRLAVLQAELQRAPNAVALAKRAWAAVSASAEKRAANAFRRIAAHVLGDDDITGATREDAAMVTQGSFCSETATGDNARELARRFRFWLCEELDDEFARCFRELPPHERAPVARLAMRSPRVWLGLAPKVSALVAPDVGPPRREARTLFPTRKTRTELHDTWFSPAGVRHASTTETTAAQEEPARDAAQVPVPVFSIAEDMTPVFGALSYEPAFTVELDNPHEKISNAPDARTRGDIAKMLCETLTVAPPVPRGNFPVWAVLSALAEETQTQQQETPFAQRLRELQDAFPLDAELLPVPAVVHTEQPTTAWVFALEALAEACTPELQLGLSSFRALLPSKAAQEDTKEHSSEFTADQRAALTTAWPLFAWFLAEVGVRCTLEEILGEPQERQETPPQTPKRPPQHPLRASAALERWHVLVTELLPSADDSIPAVVEALEKLTQRHPEARDALRWSAEIATWAGIPTFRRPDGMWCSYHSIQMRLSRLETLPMMIATEHTETETETK